MANTTIKGKFGFSILFDGATPWDSATDFPSGMCIESLELKPTATDDGIIIRETDADGYQYFAELAATKYDNKIKYFNTEKSEKRFFPFVVGNEASAGVLLIVVLK